jgi:hypothetical protein
MTSANAAASADFDEGVFRPQDVAVMRASFNQARETLPPESVTPGNLEAIAAAIVDAAKRGERDPGRLSGYALKAIRPKRPV